MMLSSSNWYSLLVRSESKERTFIALVVIAVDTIVVVPALQSILLVSISATPPERDTVVPTPRTLSSKWYARLTIW